MNNTLTITCLESETSTSNNAQESETYDMKCLSNSSCQSFFETDKLLLLIDVGSMKGCKTKRKNKQNKQANEIRTMMLKSLGKFRGVVVSVVSLIKIIICKNIIQAIL